MDKVEAGGSPELTRLARLGWNAAAMAPIIDGVRFIGDKVDVHYPDGGLAALGLDGGSSYWFDHRAQAVIRALVTTSDARSIWDIGAGAGSMSRRLVRADYDVVAVEPIPDGARAIARQGIEAVFCSSLTQLSLPGSSLRIVGLFDVVEHIEDPTELLTEVHRVLEPDGVVVLTVPAFPALWSDEDEIAGHKRRYRRPYLDRFMASLGFSKVDSQYLFASLLVPAALIRVIPYKLGRHRSQEASLAASASQLAPSPTVDRAIRGLLHIESIIAKRVRLPFGTSVMGLYRRSQC